MCKIEDVKVGEQYYLAYIVEIGHLGFLTSSTAETIIKVIKLDINKKLIGYNYINNPDAISIYYDKVSTVFDDVIRMLEPIKSKIVIQKVLLEPKSRLELIND